MSDAQSKVPNRLARNRDEMLADFRTKTSAELIDECNRILDLPAHFALGPRSYALTMMLRERLKQEVAAATDGTNVANESERGTVAYQLHLRNPHLEISTARCYVDAVCEEFAKLAPKEQQ